MKKRYKKTMWGSIIAFVLGTSCCWVSSLAIWIGGATIVGITSKYLPSFQIFFIALGVILGLISVYFYKKK